MFFISSFLHVSVHQVTVFKLLPLYFPSSFPISKIYFNLFFFFFSFSFFNFSKPLFSRLCLNRSMDFAKLKRMLYYWIHQIVNILLRLTWHLLHVTIHLFYFAINIANALESHLISKGLLRRYKSLHISKLQYLAIVIESEDCRTSNVIELLQWLADLGVKHVCLYDKEGILKKSKDFILEKFDGATLFQENDVLLDQPLMTLEFASFSDGKEAVAKAANVLFMKYLKSGSTSSYQGEQIFTESQMGEALKTVGGNGPEPDLLLVYGPARCHLGFPAWRIRYTEIQHMGPLKSMKYGSLIKAIYKFTMVQQNHGK